MKNFMILLLLMIVNEVSWARNPGIRIRLTAKGLDYAAKVAKEILDEKIKKLQIKDISGRADTPLGRVSYSLSSMKVNSFSIPTLSLKTKSDVGLDLSVSGVSIDMSGDWRYRKDHWPHIKDHGSFNINADDISFDALIKIGADSQGHPTMAAAGCSSSIGSVKVRFHGGASWLYNLFSRMVENSIKKTLQSEICKAADAAINVQGAQAFARFPVKKQLDKYTLIDYSLVSSPNFTFTYLDLLVKGEFESVAHPSEAPFSPEPLPVASRSDRMMYGWLSDYVLNTASYVYTKSGFLNRTFNPDDFPKNSSYPLNTKTFKDLIPPLYKKYPNRPMKLKAYPTKIPTVSSLTTGVNVLADFNIEMFVDLANGSSVFALTLGLEVEATLKLAVKETNLTVHSTFVRLKASLVRSAIGDISKNIKALQFFLDFFVNGMIMRKVNDRGDKGFPLPLNKGVKLVNPQITSGKSFTLVSADVSYTPSEEEEMQHDLYKKSRIRII